MTRAESKGLLHVAESVCKMRRSFQAICAPAVATESTDSFVRGKIAESETM